MFNQFILDNISWILPLLVASIGWVNRLVIYKIETRAKEYARSVTNKVHERVDKVEKVSDGLALLRKEDKERQDKFEERIIKTLDEIRDDIKYVRRQTHEG